MLTNTRSGHPSARRRKMQVDCELYCAHSVRASAGDANCDHDFETTPTIKGANFAEWNCTRCGRAFRYETWKSTARVTEDAQRPLRPRIDYGAFDADGSKLMRDPSTAG